MRLRKKKHSTLFALNMTPMIDCVFLLLIFFMTVSHISATNDEPVNLPNLPGSVEQEPSMVTINVLEDGEIRMAGVRVSMTRLISELSSELAQQGGDPSLLSVVIRADENSQSRTVNEIVRALNRLNITRVRLATEVPQGM